jgi:DNA-binding winged helix-turn-helix (wHTH) protein/Tfp pilus assembly protein PilF
MASLPPSLRFAPFDVDPRTGELRKYGARVRLSGQPVQILILLLDARGELVTREELRQRLWSDGTFVDFEHGLNAAINKLRRALGDAADRPRYIETVPGRGYRFIGTLERPSEAVHADSPSPVPDTQSKARLPRAGLVLGRWRGLVTAAATLMLLVAGQCVRHRTRPLSDKDTIVLAEFRNATDDSVFDETLRQGLAVQLQQSPFLSLVSDERIRKALGLMGQPTDARLTPDVAKELCERVGSAVVLDGSIARLGSQYVVGLRARYCRTGDILDEQQMAAARKEDVLGVLSQMAKAFRNRVGESLITIEQHNTPLAAATTPALDALKAYSTGLDVASSTGPAAAVPLLKRAVDIDPQFAMAYASLGLKYSIIGESAVSSESTRTAYRLRNRTSDRERFFITALYDRQVTGNLDKEQETLHLWAQTYPRDADAHGLLAGFGSQGTAQYEQSIAAANRAINLDPDLTPSYLSLAFTNLYLDRVADAERVIERAVARKLDAPDFALLRYYIAFLRGDTAGMHRALALAAGQLGAEDWLSHAEGLVLARAGQLQGAADLSRRASAIARRAGQRERAATFEAGAAVWNAFFGQAAAARQRATEALELSNGRDVTYAAAFALSLSGDDTRSHVLADDLATRFPEDTSVQFNYLPTLRGLFALHSGAFAEAIHFLQQTDQYELAIPGIAFNGFFGALYPAFVRGEMYLSEREGAKAVTEFHKILNHRGLVLGDPVTAVARLELGRASTVSGEPKQAKAAYEQFLALWHDADPDLALLKVVRAEYAKLP